VKLSVDAKPISPEEFTAFLTKERNKWTVVVRAAGVQME
jgi:tripartite-type tricarboxylate transporter receptor subunit TctC